MNGLNQGFGTTIFLPVDSVLLNIDQPQNAIRGKLINTTTDNWIPELVMLLKLCNKTQKHIFFF